jgi:hypothetical protein
MKILRPARFLTARAWRSRVCFVVAALLLPWAVRVVWLEAAWSGTDACRVRSARVVQTSDGFVVHGGVVMEDPTCVLDIRLTVPFPTRAAAEVALGTLPAGKLLTCHRASRLCGASIERPHVSGPFWIFPVAVPVLVAAAVALGRGRSASPRHARGGPFRAPATVVPDEKAPIAIEPPRPGVLERVLAAIFGGLLAAPGLVGTPVLLIVLWLQPLNETAFPLIILIVALLLAGMLLGGLVMLWGRRRLLIDGSGRHACDCRAIGPLDIARVYRSFDDAPTVTVVERRSQARHGTILGGWDVVLAGDRGELRLELDTEADAGAAAEAIRAHLAPHPGPASR